MAGATLPTSSFSMYCPKKGQACASTCGRRTEGRIDRWRDGWMEGWKDGAGICGGM